jgi:XTP/dITP diphosphohydrolase
LCSTFIFLYHGLYFLRLENKLRRFEPEMQAFAKLLTIMEDLREKCPWDKKQTMDSLRILTIEETYELAEEIINQSMEGVREEVGDLMLHLVFYSKIASELEAWGIVEMLEGICEKLIRRHPHIYGDLKVEGEEEVKRNWEAIKLSEGKKSVLQGVPRGLPAMVKAFRIQEKVKPLGFQWEKAGQAWDKVKEEEKELQDALQASDFNKVKEEFGDWLFSAVNYARYLGVDPEEALERTNQKFIRRFRYIEEKAGSNLSSMNLDEMDVLWQQAKAEGL